MTTKGQITVPKDVRDELRLEAGTKVEFIRVGPGEYRLRPKNVDIMDLAGMAKYDGTPLTIEEMNEGIREAWAGLR